LPVTKFLKRRLADSFNTTINITTNRTCEAPDRTSPNNLKPVIARMRRSRFNEQASWLIRLSVIHVTHYANSALLALHAAPNRGRVAPALKIPVWAVQTTAWFRVEMADGRLTNREL
jgi:hypothetical protein